VRVVSLIPAAIEILEAIGLGAEIVALGPEQAAGSGTGALADAPWERGLPARPERSGQDGRAPRALPSAPPGSAAAAELLASALRAARPDLIFTSATEAGGGVPRPAVRRAVAAVRPRPAVFALEPHTLGDILSDVKTVGDATGRQQPARALIEALRARIDAVSLRSAHALAAGRARRVACLSSVDPPTAAGWWLAELVGLAGGLDVLDGIGRPPRAVSWDEVEAARPELVVGFESGPTVERDEIALDGRPYPGPHAVDLLEQLAALILRSVLPRT
jgi:iron complex transport system substrate-binding protein